MVRRLHGGSEQAAGEGEADGLKAKRSHEEAPSKRNNAIL